MKYADIVPGTVYHHGVECFMLLMNVQVEALSDRNDRLQWCDLLWLVSSREGSVLYTDHRIADTEVYISLTGTIIVP